MCTTSEKHNLDDKSFDNYDFIYFLTKSVLFKHK